jgi:hypothetical protein
MVALGTAVIVQGGVLARCVEQARGVSVAGWTRQGCASWSLRLYDTAELAGMQEARTNRLECEIGPWSSGLARAHFLGISGLGVIL